jgi:hypothetical protein
MSKAINFVLMIFVVLSAMFVLVGIMMAIDPIDSHPEAARRGFIMIAGSWITSVLLGTLLAYRYSRELHIWIPICLIPGFGPIALVLAGDFYGRSPLMDFITEAMSAASTKVCSGCGKRVPIKSASGQRCPWCNAKWA